MRSRRQKLGSGEAGKRGGSEGRRQRTDDRSWKSEWKSIALRAERIA